MVELIDDYIERHIDAEPEYLAQLRRETHLFHLRPRMVSGHLQGRLLKMLVQMVKPHTVLELGTFTGYSALCIAEGLTDNDMLHTIEIDDEIEDFTRSHFAKYEVAKRITMHIGDAKEIVPSLNTSFELVFIDANKREYIDYFNIVFPHIPIGGYIIADNTLWDGKVVTDPESRDAQTRGIEQFNDMIATDTRVEKVILPLRDGLTIIRKISE